MADEQDPLPPGQVAPRSVVYGRLLLTIQASLWGLVVLPAATVVALNLQPNVVRHTAADAAVFVSVSLGALLFMLGMSAVSAYLAANLKSGRANIRHATVAVEAFMALFGLLIAFAEASTGGGIITGLSVSAGLVGTMLSLTAAVGLLSKAAKTFTRSARSA